MFDRRPDCSIIIVSYQHRQYLSGCLRSLINGEKKLNLEIIVIDNNSSDGAIDSLNPDIFNEITLVKNNRNLGFAKACNQGIRMAKSNIVMFVNPDVLTVSGSIQKMLKFLKLNLAVSCVVPVLKNIDGSIQYSCRKFPGWKETLLKRTPLRWFVDPEEVNRYSRRTVDLINRKIPFQINWALGGCLMVKRSTFDTIGGLDEKFFLYCEDIDWFYRLEKAGLKAYCLPEAIMYHKHLAVSDHKLPSVESFYHSVGILRFVFKHAGDILTGRYPPKNLI